MKDEFIGGITLINIHFICDDCGHEFDLTMVERFGVISGRPRCPKCHGTISTRDEIEIRDSVDRSIEHMKSEQAKIEQIKKKAFNCRDSLYMP